MIPFIENIGDYFSQNYFTEDFPNRVFARAGYSLQKKKKDADSDQEEQTHVDFFNKKIRALGEKYYRFKTEFLNQKRVKDKIRKTHEFHSLVLKALGYDVDRSYEHPVYLDSNEIIPVRSQYKKGGKPALFIMEMNAIIAEGDEGAEGIYDQSYSKEDWENVFPEDWKDLAIKPDVIKEAITEISMLSEQERPEYLMLLAGPKIFLVQYEKWKFDSYLLFDLERLFDEAKISANKNFLALFYALTSKQQLVGEGDNILNGLNDEAHKAAHGVTKTLKDAVIFAVESLANEAIEYERKQAEGNLDAQKRIDQQLQNENFARELKDDCLTYVYRLLFLFYAEAREDLEILPVSDSTYQKGYSVEMLRDLELVPLTTDESRSGYFFSESLWKLFDFLHEGSDLKDGFEMSPLDSPLFDNKELKHLAGVQFKNVVLQEIIVRLSLSERTKKGRGRISYANLGINQLGSVYESLLAYSGFFAKEPMIEVKAAKDKTGKDGTYLVPKRRRDDFKEDEILKQEDERTDVEIKEGKFLYRLNGRDRQKSASFYTPEVLTQTTVKYTLKGILEPLREKQNVVDGKMLGEPCADEILKLKILEPAMGAAAFHNEVVNQLAVAYLELKENEELHRGQSRIVPGKYNEELQKVKAYIASNNVYGVDLNPTAVELGKLSLWLNCMHSGMETPFFAHRIAAGNAVVGAWFKVYNEKDISQEFDKKKKVIKKEWWNIAPRKLPFILGENQQKKDWRKKAEIYHFLLPDSGMLSSASTKRFKEELDDKENKAFIKWKKAFCAPLEKHEIQRLQKISSLIDVLLDQHFRKMKKLAEQTGSVYNIYGREGAQHNIAYKSSYTDKERLSNARQSRTAPYFKLKMIMDYWCSLWYWDIRDFENLPTREDWYNELESLLQVDTSKLQEGANQKELKQALNLGVQDFRLFKSTRIESVEKNAQTYRFFHPQLEFIEVFEERGGFDVIVGNPPWVNIEFDEAGIIGEVNPEVLIRKHSAPKVKKDAVGYLAENEQLTKTYNEEVLWAEGSKAFLGAYQNYPLLSGQRNNLYKCVLTNSLDELSMSGFAGLVHPESLYDDPRGESLRSNIYQRLKYHFEHKNSLFLFPEVHDQMNYGVHIYSGKSGEISFLSINNLFHPSTIDQSLQGANARMVGGIKVKDDSTGKYVWNTEGHQDRVIHYTPIELKVLARTFENSTKYQGTKLVSIHSRQIINVLEKLSNFKGRVQDFNFSSTVCWNETNEVASGVISKETKYPDFEEYEMVYSGPHFYVSSPFYKSPYSECNNNSDYDCIDLENITTDFLPRTNYVITKKLVDDFKADSSREEGPNLWINKYKVAFSKMLNVSSERTIQPALLLPKVSHIHGVLSVLFDSNKLNVEFLGLCSSLVFDFYIKTLGKSNLGDEVFKSMPIGIDERYKSILLHRTLLLNCLNSYYSSIWEELFTNSWQTQSWSVFDDRLPDLKNNTEKWEIATPLRNSFSRRWALIEIDVVCALAFGLTLEELKLIYNVQFPVLQQNEDDTWYDQKGKIVFTCSSGLKGVGMDRKDWLLVKDQTEGTVRHIIQKSKMYEGKEVIYHAPFEKCDRLKDYEVAWAHFEKIFNS